MSEALKHVERPFGRSCGGSTVAYLTVAAYVG